MMYQRYGGLKVLDHSYDTGIDAYAWMNDGVRHVHCWSIAPLMRGAGDVNDAPRTERSSRLGQIYAEMFSSERTTPSELLVRLCRGWASASHM